MAQFVKRLPRMQHFGVEINLIYFGISIFVTMRYAHWCSLPSSFRYWLDQPKNIRFISYIKLYQWPFSQNSYDCSLNFIREIVRAFHKRIRSKVSNGLIFLINHLNRKWAEVLPSESILQTTDHQYRVHENNVIQECLKPTSQSLHVCKTMLI